MIIKQQVAPEERATSNLGYVFLFLFLCFKSFISPFPLCVLKKKERKKRVKITFEKVAIIVFIVSHPPHCVELLASSKKELITGKETSKRERESDERQ